MSHWLISLMGDYCWNYAGKIVPKVKIFIRHFSHNTPYFATLDNELITAERTVDSEFTKYVNNNGNPCVLGKAPYSSKQTLWCIFLMKQATKSFCWLIWKGRSINYMVQTHYNYRNINWSSFGERILLNWQS